MDGARRNSWVGEPTGWQKEAMDDEYTNGNFKFTSGCGNTDSENRRGSNSSVDSRLVNIAPMKISEILHNYKGIRNITLKIISNRANHMLYLIDNTSIRGIIFYN